MSSQTNKNGRNPTAILVLDLISHLFIVKFVKIYQRFLQELNKSPQKSLREIHNSKMDLIVNLRIVNLKNNLNFT